jgi:CysZ protein
MSDLAVRSPDPLAPAASPERPRRLAGFRDGLKGPFKGVSFLLRRPSLWPLALVPAAVASAITAGLGTIAVLFVPNLVRSITGTTSSWYGALGVSTLVVLATAAAVVLGFVAGLLLAQPLSGPALERLVRAMEKHLGAPERPKVPLWRELARSTTGVLVGFACGLPVLAVLFAVDLIVPGSGIVTFPIKLVVTGMMITWDLLDYPFSVRGWRVGLRIGWVKANLGAALGFGLALALVCLVPCLQILLLPAGAVGATWLLHARGDEGDR